MSTIRGRFPFGGLAGELVLPPVRLRVRRIRFQRSRSGAVRLFAGFRAGWSRFMLCSVHILWGKGKSTATQEPADRVEEIKNVANFSEEAHPRQDSLVSESNTRR